jgi:regulator of sigma E protease
MTLFISVITFLVIFSILVLIHEAGHFWAARKAGIKVEEFGFGLPPRLWGKKTTRKVEYKDKNGKKKKDKETMIWSLNWIPFGGFVRMLGEDDDSKEAKSDPRSFGNRPIGWRIIVVCAGVIMNFLLAWFLLVVIFSIGVDPVGFPSASDKEYGDTFERGVVKAPKDFDLFAFAPMTMTKEGIQKNIDNGVVEVLDGPGVQIAGFTSEESPAKQAELKYGDIITAVDGKEVRNTQELIAALDINKEIEGIQISSVAENSIASEKDLKPGDIITFVDQTPIKSVEDLKNKLKEEAKGAGFHVSVDRRKEDGTNETRTKVLMPDEKGEIGVSFLEKGFYFDLLLKRDGELKKDMKFVLLDENNKLGVGIFPCPPILKINKIQLPFYQAPIAATTESVKLSVLTVKMLGQVVTTVLQKFAVPEGVAGPVGIAQMTHELVEIGEIVRILMFMALISISLAVVNIMPFPALDGGRLIFLLFEFITGKKPNAKWEATIHAIGLIVLLGLIFLVTWSDIVRIVSNLKN